MPIRSKHVQGIEQLKTLGEGTLTLSEQSQNRITRKNILSHEGREVIGQVVSVGTQEFEIYRDVNRMGEQRSSLLLVLKELSDVSPLEYHSSVLEQLVKERFLDLKEIIEAGVILNLNAAQLLGVNLIGARLEVSAVNTTFEGSNLTNANLQGCNLEGANLTDTNLTGTTMPKGWKGVVGSVQGAVLNKIKEA